MVLGSVATAVEALVVGAVVLGLVVAFLRSSLKVVQQGCVGVVKRFGEFRAIKQPGLHVLIPSPTGWTGLTSASSRGQVTSRRSSPRTTSRCGSAPPSSAR